MRLLLAVLFPSLVAFAQVTLNTGLATSPLHDAKRLLVVTTPAWNSVDGSLQRFERHGETWVKVGDAIPIVVGENGMGYDPVWYSASKPSPTGPVKHEGDGRSPAGVFEIGTAFGFDSTGPTARKYIPLTAATECVDDVKSEHYAHIVERNKVLKVDWNSSEKMRDIGVYKLGMVVNYNVAKTVPGNGSCIFLHIWKGPGRGTAGCTAMNEAALEELVKWIGAEKAALVQMPAAEYDKVKKILALP